MNLCLVVNIILAVCAIHVSQKICLGQLSVMEGSYKMVCFSSSSHTIIFVMATVVTGMNLVLNNIYTQAR